MQKCAGMGIKPTNPCLLVSLSLQTVRLYADGVLTKTYVASTSRRPPSNVKGSLGTPRGLHALAEKIGAGTPPGIVFKSRVSTGRHFLEFSPAEQKENLITTRILWLRGLEPGVNQGGDVDTYDRYVYFHGTNHEERLGTPASGGCVLLSNLDIIELFERVRVGNLVLVED